MPKCKWCGTVIEEEGFCSPWHKANFNSLMPRIRHPSVSEEWEFDFSPLKEDKNG